MKKRSSVVHKFVEFIPNELEDGVVYVSIEYATVVHKCCCGCGIEVVTPLTPTDWSLNFNGDTISLNPSIGDWSFPCQSHYWIKKGRIEWAGRWTQEKIDAGKRKDRLAKQDYFEKGTPEAMNESLHTSTKSQLVKVKIWQKMITVLKSIFK